MGHSDFLYTIYRGLTVYHIKLPVSSKSTVKLPMHGPSRNHYFIINFINTLLVESKSILKCTSQSFYYDK